MYYHPAGSIGSGYKITAGPYGNSPQYIETRGGPISVQAPDSNCAGAIIVDSMGQAGAGVQTIAIADGQTKTITPTGRVILRIEATAGYVVII